MAKAPSNVGKNRSFPLQEKTVTISAAPRDARYHVRKIVKWMGDAKDVMSAFPDDVKQAGGEELFRVQCGLDAHAAKPIENVGPGTYEIRLSKAGGWFRVFYVAKFADAVYVLHAFQKKTNTTSKADMDVGRVRYAMAAAEAKKVAAAKLKGGPADTTR